jgi:hypothetical protein
MVESVPDAASTYVLDCSHWCLPRCPCAGTAASCMGMLQTLVFLCMSCRAWLQPRLHGTEQSPWLEGFRYYKEMPSSLLCLVAQFSHQHLFSCGVAAVRTRFPASSTELQSQQLSFILPLLACEHVHQLAVSHGNTQALHVPIPCSFVVTEGVAAVCPSLAMSTCCLPCKLILACGGGAISGVPEMPVAGKDS